MLTAERLRELLDYDPATGVFTWRVSRGRVRAGEVAGCDTHGYVVIRIDDVLCLAHRLAWLHVYGDWPLAEIDHRNGDSTDNRIENLRDVSHSVNKQNQRRSNANNTSGLLGVCKSGNRWQAGIKIDGRQRHIGRFDTPELAHAAYLAAKRQIHPGCTI